MILNQELLASAFRYYSSRGWQVIPCHTIAPDGCCTCGKPDCSSPGKHPRYDAQILPHGLTSATTDFEAITAWLHKWPVSNIAVICGPESNLVALDIDPDKGGDESLLALVSEHGKLPQTIEALTGGGGRHILFSHPGIKIKPTSSQLGPGLDIRGDGSYIIAAPSLHVSGMVYEWEPSCRPSQTELAPMPEWLIDLTKEDKKAETPAQTESREAIFKEGARNQTLASLAGTMRRRGMDFESVFAALLTENQRKCSPPLSETEVKRIAQSINRYAPTNAPRSKNGHGLERRPPQPANESIYDFLGLLDNLHNRIVPTNITPIDEALAGMERQTVTVLAARPSMGKSSLAWQIGLNIASAGLRSLFLSLEMSSNGLWAKTACGALGYRWLDFLAGKATPEMLNKITSKASEMMDLYGDRLYIDDQWNNLETISASVESLRPDFLLIDHLRLVGAEDESEIRRLGRIVDDVKQLAKSYNLAAMIIAQLNRGTESRDNKRPNLADLRESGQIEENADNVWMLYRDDYYNDDTPDDKKETSITELLVRKFRYDVRGQRITMNYHLKNQWFSRIGERAYV